MIAGKAGQKSRQSSPIVGQRAARGYFRRTASQPVISISIATQRSPGRMPPSRSWMTETPVTVP